MTNQQPTSIPSVAHRNVPSIYHQNSGPPITAGFKPKMSLANRNLRRARNRPYRPQRSSSQSSHLPTEIASKPEFAHHNPLQAKVTPCPSPSTSSQNSHLPTTDYCKPEMSLCQPQSTASHHSPLPTTICFKPELARTPTCRLASAPDQDSPTPILFKPATTPSPHP